MKYQLFIVLMLFLVVCGACSKDPVTPPGPTPTPIPTPVPTPEPQVKKFTSQGDAILVEAEKK